MSDEQKAVIERHQRELDEACAKYGPSSIRAKAHKVVLDLLRLAAKAEAK